ncbi:MAG: M56 family metallopeptidase [Thiolinea sp.]
MLEYIVLGNVVLLISFLLVLIFEFILKRTRFRRAYKLRLNLAVTALCAAALPFILTPFSSIISSALSVNATDLFVSHYLKGNLSLTASQVSDVLLAKDSLIESLVNATTAVSALVLFIFIAAACLRAIYIGLNVGKIYLLIQRAKPIHQTGRISVWASDMVEVPFSTRGLLNYHIVLPASMLPEQRAVRIALGHEAQHIRQRDVDWEILLSLISPLFVLNPAFWCISDRIRRFREYSCDAALLQQSRFDAKEYCLLLLDIATRGAAAKSTPALATSVPFWGREGIFNRSNNSALRQRVLALSNNAEALPTGATKHMNWVPATLLLVTMVLMISFVAKPADWSYDRLMLSSVINLERLDKINGFGVKPLR